MVGWQKVNSLAMLLEIQKINMLRVRGVELGLSTNT